MDGAFEGQQADDAGEENDGNKSTQEAPAGGLDILLCFCLTLLSVGREGCIGPKKQRKRGNN